MRQAIAQAGRTRPARSHVAGRWLLFWTLFIGLGAVAGASGMLLDPTGRAMGMDTMLPYFQTLPLAEYLYQDYVFPGFALLVVNGLTNLTAAVLLLRRERLGVALGGVFGVTLMLWICIQFVIFPLNVMSTSYFIFGFCQAVTGFMTWVFCRQEAFQAAQAAQAAQADEPGDGRDKTRLVVYFSRMGYVRKLAREAAGRTGAQLYEIRAAARTGGTAGFWWCGRFAMHRWAMPIQPVTLDLTAYDHVTICTPIWVFSLASPVRAFCRQAAGQIREADYILVHHTGGRYASVAAEMDRLLGVKHTGCVNVRCRMGEYALCPSGGNRAC